MSSMCHTMTVGIHGHCSTQRENEVCCEEGVFSTKVFRVTSPITMVTMFFRGCLRQPLYCFQIDVFIWLHVTDIYIIRQPTVVRQCLHL